MNVQNEPVHDRKRETPPALRWKLCDFQHRKSSFGNTFDCVEGIRFGNKFDWVKGVSHKSWRKRYSNRWRCGCRIKQQWLQEPIEGAWQSKVYLLCHAPSKSKCLLWSATALPAASCAQLPFGGAILFIDQMSPPKYLVNKSELLNQISSSPKNLQLPPPFQHNWWNLSKPIVSSWKQAFRNEESSHEPLRMTDDDDGDFLDTLQLSEKFSTLHSKPHWACSRPWSRFWRRRLHHRPHSPSLCTLPPQWGKQTYYRPAKG